MTAGEIAGKTEATVASTSLRWGSGASPRQRLFADASLFSFYQAVKLLSISHAEAAPHLRHGSVPVSFRSTMNFEFPGTEIERLSPATGEEAFPEMLVNFIGVAGAHGPLPSVYAERMARQTRSALRDFLDIFNQRLVLLLYRVHEMHHPELTPTSPEKGLAANHLYALFGVGRDPESKARNRLAVQDRALLDYSGLFAHRPRSAAGLQRLLSDYFKVEVSVEQFRGAWLDLSKDQWTYIGTRGGRNHELGNGAVLGRRAWDQHAGVTIRLGPLDLETFESFLPNGGAYKPLCDLSRFYLGNEIDFAFKLELRTDQIPWAEPLPIGPLLPGSRRPALGRLAWLKTPGTATNSQTYTAVEPDDEVSNRGDL